MKILPAFLSLLVLGTCAFGAGAADLQRLLSEAQVAMIRGDLDTAKRNFGIVYQLDQSNKVAIAGLKQIKIEEAKKGNNTAEKDFAKVIMPQVSFKEATLGEALDFLKKKVTEASGGKQTANFVVQPGVDQGAKVTLSLSNVPFTEVLRYLSESVNAKIEYQKYAIVVKSAGGAVIPTSAPPASLPPQ
jgi:hypothetical protein